MKIEIDKHGRKLYKFNHSVAQGGYLYAHKTKDGAVMDKAGLKNLLETIVKKHELFDATIKVYDSFFFLFFMFKPSLKLQDLIGSIQESSVPFGTWDEDYIWTGVYDLQEKFVRKDLERFGYNYEEG